MDKTAQLWEAATGKRVGPPLEHLDTVFAIAFSPDGKTLLTASDDATARVWQASSGMALHTMLHLREVRAAAFSPNGESVLTGGWDRTARLWDVTLPTTIEHQDVVSAVAFSPDGKTVLTGSRENRGKMGRVDGQSGGTGAATRMGHLGGLQS